MGILDQFKSPASLSPLQRITQDVKAISNLTKQFENSASDLFTNALSKAGLSSSSISTLTTAFSDSVSNGLSDNYFQTAESVVNRVTGQQIFDGIAPRFAETSATAVNRISSNLDSLSSTDDVSFPPDIGKYYMDLSFREYTRTAPQAKANMVFKNSIKFPIPAALGDQVGVNIQTNRLGFVGGVFDLLQAASSTKQNGETFDATSAAGAVAYSFASSMLSDVNIPYAGKAGDSVNQLAGTIPNPHVAAIFQGVPLRSYELSWKFFPRNADESKTLQFIIKRLKANSLPTFSKLGTAILDYPYMCFVNLYPWASNKGNELIKFKPSLLTKVDVDYTNQGLPSFFAGTNLPTVVTITVAFVELEYFTAEDFGRSAENDTTGKIANNLSQIADSVGAGNAVSSAVTWTNGLVNKFSGTSGSTTFTGTGGS